MCRTLSEGGRRCPCSSAEATRDAHNSRRRQNRAVRTAVVSWARAGGVPGEALAVLAAAPPSIVKQWADLAGAPASLLEAAPARVDKPMAVADAYWATPQLVDAIAAIARLQGKSPGELQLLQGAVVRSDWPAEHGINDTRRVWLSNGVEGYHKRFSGLDDDCAEESFSQNAGLQPVHEVGAWVLARGLGDPWASLVPECVLRPAEGHLGSFARAAGGEPGSPYTAVRPALLAAAGFFDALIGQQDRHLGNLLVEGDQIRLIDHGFSFARKGDPYNAAALQKYRRDRDPSLTADELKALRRLVKSTDLLGLEGMLEEERSAALRDRAERMLRTATMPGAGEF